MKHWLVEMDGIIETLTNRKKKIWRYFVANTKKHLVEFFFFGNSSSVEILSQTKFKALCAWIRLDKVEGYFDLIWSYWVMKFPIQTHHMCRNQLNPSHKSWVGGLCFLASCIKKVWIFINYFSTFFSGLLLSFLLFFDNLIDCYN